MPDIIIPDVSEYQGVIDHEALVGYLKRQYGFGCVIARLNYGNSKVDNYADANIDGLRNAAADALGWYTYLIQDQDPVVQAQVLARVLIAHGGLRRNEFVVCDDEEGTGDQSPRVNSYLQEVDYQLKTAGGPDQLWWYSYLNFVQVHNLEASMGRRWIAAYSFQEPSLPHDLWQNTDAAQFPGIQGPVDASVFHGSGQDFLALLGIQPPPPVPPDLDIFHQEAEKVLVAIYGSEQHLYYVDAGGTLHHFWQPVGGRPGGPPFWYQNDPPSGTGLVGLAPVTGDVFGNAKHVYALRPDGSVMHFWQALGSAEWSSEVVSGAA